MTDPFRVFVRCLCSMLLGTALVLPGCSSASDTVVRTDVEIPQFFESEGITWNNTGAMSDDDLNLLTHVFRARPELSDSPELRGDPAIFANEDRDRRYYWVKQTGDQVTWNCVGLEGGQFVFTEGDGTPF